MKHLEVNHELDVRFLILWVVLAVTVLALFVWRKTVARNEDDNLHVLDGAAVQQTRQQAAVAQKLELIDKWGKILTIVTRRLRPDPGRRCTCTRVWVQNTNIGVVMS